MDNGTAAWGQGSDATSGWVDPDEPGKASGWGNPSPNPGKPGKDLKQKKTTKKTPAFCFSCVDDASTTYQTFSNIALLSMTRLHEC